MAQPEIPVHRFPRYRIIFPRFLPGKGIVGTVQTVDRREDAELQPADGQFVAAVPVHMSADIMAPPAISDIA